MRFSCGCACRQCFECFDACSVNFSVIHLPISAPVYTAMGTLPQILVKALLGAGFGKNCPQITSSKRVSGKIRETQELGAFFLWLRLPPMLRELPSVLRLG